MLVMIANAAAARVFDYQVNEAFTLAKEFEHPESRQKGSDLVSDRPGHNEGKGGGQGAFVPANNPKQIEAERFARELAEWLDSERKQNSYKQLMLVADPRFLGLLNKSLNNQTKQLIFDTLDKDYSQIKQRDLPEMLGLRISA